MTLEPRRPRPPAYPRRATAADLGRSLLPWLRGLITPSICVFLLLLTPSVNAADPVGSAKSGGASSELPEMPCKGKVAAPEPAPPCRGAPAPNPPTPQQQEIPCKGDYSPPPIDNPPPCSGESVAPSVNDPPPCGGFQAPDTPTPPTNVPCTGSVPAPIPVPPSTTLFRDVSLGAFCADPKSWLALQVRMRGSIRRMSDPDYPGGGFVLEDGTNIGSALARAPLVGGVRESDTGPATIEGRVVQIEGRNPLTRQTGTWYAISVDRIILDQR